MSSDNLYAQEAQAEAAMDATASGATDLASLRAAAMPADYSGTWYTRALDASALGRFESALSAAATEAASRQYGAASATCAALLSDPDYRVAQDMAIRGARYALDAGDPATALSLVRRGRARSSANTPFLAYLLRLEGEILEQQGDLEGARRAYEAAARYNAAR
jgi:predicted negative regulator of RcsB-dependent stress response